MAEGYTSSKVKEHIAKHIPVLWACGVEQYNINACLLCQTVLRGHDRTLLLYHFGYMHWSVATLTEYDGLYGAC
jgi:hypothetical protein